MGNNLIYNAFLFSIPTITISGNQLSNVYGRILNIFYNGKTGEGIIGLEIGETQNLQITYRYEIALTMQPNGVISAQQIVSLVLANLPNSTLIEQ